MAISAGLPSSADQRGGAGAQGRRCCTTISRPRPPSPGSIATRFAGLPGCVAWRAPARPGLPRRSTRPSSCWGWASTARLTGQTDHAAQRKAEPGTPAQRTKWPGAAPNRRVFSRSAWPTIPGAMRLSASVATRAAFQLLTHQRARTPKQRAPGGRGQLLLLHQAEILPVEIQGRHRCRSLGAAVVP